MTRYRFDNITGQKEAVRFLQNAVSTGHVPHALILCGERGIGKMDLAMAFAAALQCTTAPSSPVRIEPCGHCRACKQIAVDAHPDVIVVTNARAGAETKTNTIGVKTARFVQGDVSIKPYEGPYKIYIIPDAHNMNQQAQNALLKTLEEPPGYAVMVLLAERTDHFLPTILSRCITIRLHPVGEDDLMTDLVNKQNNVLDSRLSAHSSVEAGTGTETGVGRGGHAAGDVGESDRIPAGKSAAGERDAARGSTAACGRNADSDDVVAGTEHLADTGRLTDDSPGAESDKTSQDRAVLCARLSHGNPGRCRQLAFDEGLWQFRMDFIGFMKRMPDVNSYEIVQYVESLTAKDADHVDDFLDFGLSWFRDILTAKGRDSSAAGSALIFADEITYIYKVKDALSYGALERIFRAFDDAARRRAAKGNDTQILEVLLLNIRRAMHQR